ncbi:hypothetical protein [Streptomyces sp. NPDC056549]|uniref:hypothetical protein n=1 Tax=Streptomyces sp. NPDC056549 TaxID=3345864 RepID=UPI00367785F3
MAAFGRRAARRVRWQLLALTGGLPGLPLVTTGLLARRRDTALRCGLVPALRVLQRLDHGGLTWVSAVDDAAESAPLFAYMCGLVPLDTDEREAFGAEFDVVHDADDIVNVPINET